MFVDMATSSPDNVLSFGLLREHSTHDRSIRPAPPGRLASQYALCPSGGGCSFGVTCPYAHSSRELASWQQQSPSWRNGFQNRTLSAEINMRLLGGMQPNSLLREYITGVDMYIDKNANQKLNKKSETVCWIFTISSKECVTAITLLDTDTSDNFSIQAVHRKLLSADAMEKFSVEGDGVKEWKYPLGDASELAQQTFKVKVGFKCSSYGKYQQRVVFSFDRAVYLYRKLTVTVQPSVITNHPTELASTEMNRWESLSDVEIVNWPHQDPEDSQLQSMYQRPEDVEQCIDFLKKEKKASIDNYRLFSHSLLYIEETEQFHELSKLKVSGMVQFSKSYTSETLADTTTNYSQPDELFGKLALTTSISEDSLQGRILLQNVNFLLISCSTRTPPEKVFECKILEHSKDYVIFRAASTFIEQSRIVAKTSRRCQVQFIVNRLPFCEMHSAIDSLKSVSRLFPPSTPNISWRPALDAVRDFEVGDTSRLNSKQRNAMMTMIGPAEQCLPPVLLIGPFGTGKTLTLAATIIHLLRDDSSRVLVCTHSNSAADLYIKDHIHPYLTDTGCQAKVVRVFYKHRWTAAVHPRVKKYAVFDSARQSFKTPTFDDLANVKVVVTTLSTCYSLTQLNLPKGFFTHIMVDEAAQAKELETLIPLVLADENTRIIMAGDHMQINPDVFSKHAKKYGLHESLFERFANIYSDSHCCKITLNANYRSHKALVDYSSQTFYNDLLEAKGEQSPHPELPPLIFIAARGESLQHEFGTGYYNVAEVHETMDLLTYLVNSWPEHIWGEFNSESIGVVLPYMDQVVLMRALLKEKAGLFRQISVERVFNVQGKQFRVVVINAVRTYHSCKDIDENESDFGFLSNPKLLNTAITRAQSLVVIIGDPFSLVTTGKCRDLWIHFLDQCSQKRSLYGVTFSQLQDYLDYMDVEKAYKLNPQAIEFIPVQTVQEPASPTPQVLSQQVGQPCTQAAHFLPSAQTTNSIATSWHHLIGPPITMTAQHSSMLAATIRPAAGLSTPSFLPSTGIASPFSVQTVPPPMHVNPPLYSPAGYPPPVHPNTNLLTQVPSPEVDYLEELGRSWRQFTS